MKTKDCPLGCLQMLEHHGVRIVELNFARKSSPAHDTLIFEYAFILNTLARNARARVLVDFDDAPYQPRLSAAWRDRFGLFGERVEKCAVTGASRLTASAVLGLATPPAFMARPQGLEPAVIFKSREDALDWLAL